jgi:hypothetical protein
VDEPACGFTGSKCDYRPYIYGGIALAVVLLLIVFFGLLRYYQFVLSFKLFFINNNKHRSKQKLLKMLWRIDMQAIAFEESARFLIFLLFIILKIQCSIIAQQLVAVCIVRRVRQPYRTRVGDTRLG